MKPLHTITFANCRFRIFASPRTGPDHPWGSFDDLAAIGQVDRDEWAKKIRDDAPDELHEMADGGLLLSEPMVSGMFQAWICMGYEMAQGMLDDWNDAWSEVFAMQYGHLPRAEWLRVFQQAELRSLPTIKGVTVMQ